MAETSQEMSLATGGFHNGYLASALALGIPASLFFICLLFGNIFLNAMWAYSLQKRDSFLSEAHCFVCAFLLADAVGIFVGTDVNDPMIWFVMALGLFTRRLRDREARKAKGVPASVRRAFVGQLVPQ